MKNQHDKKLSLGGPKKSVGKSIATDLFFAYSVDKYIVFIIY